MHRASAFQAHTTQVKGITWRDSELFGTGSSGAQWIWSCQQQLYRCYFTSRGSLLFSSHVTYCRSYSQLQNHAVQISTAYTLLLQISFSAPSVAGKASPAWFGTAPASLTYVFLKATALMGRTRNYPLQMAVSITSTERQPR